LSDGPRLSLFWRVFLADAAVLVAATLVLALAPITISSPLHLQELVVLLVGLTVMLFATIAVLHRTLRPLEDLTETMRRIDPLSPGQRVEVADADSDVAALTIAFNDMLDRLEAERRDSARRALSVQEAERRRVARELHDEVGQTLTAMLLLIEGLADDVDPSLRDDIEELRETARIGAEDVRRIAQRLRPEALEELGLQSALLALVGEFAEHTKIPTDRRIASEPPLGREQELVVYRVAQEGLTNIARHADAGHAAVSLDEADGFVVLTVRDDGRGATPEELASSYGIRGMRERAMLIGATLTVDAVLGEGTEITLRVPVGEPGS
jgi:two-component system sensor histidine kinase UhpB